MDAREGLLPFCPDILNSSQQVLEAAARVAHAFAQLLKLIRRRPQRLIGAYISVIDQLRLSRSNLTVSVTHLGCIATE